MGTRSFVRHAFSRVVFCYLVVYNLPFPLGWIPGTGELAWAYERVWRVVVPWVGKYILRLAKPITVFTNGSGDTTYDYVRVLCMAVLAVGCGLAWAWVDRDRKRNARLHAGLRVYLRYALALIMILYGTAKVFGLQFPEPGLHRLLDTYGRSSPMGLAWTFIGYSTPYAVFGGVLEILGAGLLFFRRTTTLGALLVSVVMGNVVMLNMCYDIPVKLFSMHLLVMALVLIAPDLGRLANVLVLNEAAEPANLTSPFVDAGARQVALWAKTLIIAFVFITAGQRGLDQCRALRALRTSPIRGVYEVERFVRDGQPVPPLTTEDARWRRLASDYRSYLAVQMMDDGKVYFRSTFEAGGRLVLQEFGRMREDVFTWTWDDPQHLKLEGTFRGKPVTISLERLDTSEFEILSRGFHWINEYPYHR